MRHVHWLDLGRRWILLAALALPLACQSAQDSPPPLDTLTPPELAGLEAPVRTQIATAFDAWQQLRDDPDTPAQSLGRAAGELALVLHAHGLEENALEAYRLARRQAPGEHRWAYFHGVLLQESGHVEAATEPLERAAVAAPGDLPTRLRLARSLLAAGRSEAAKTHLQRALTLDPLCALAYFLAGELELAHGDASAAVMAFERALELRPAADNVHGALAAAFDALGKKDRAETHRQRAGDARLHVADPLRAALEELDVSSAGHLRRAQRARLAGDVEGALASHRLAIEAAPTSAATHAALGAYLAERGKLDDALAEMRSAMRLGGDDPRVLANLAEVHRLRGEASEAAAVYRRLLELHPKSAAGRLGLARALAEGGDTQAAIETYRAVVQEKSGDDLTSTEMAAAEMAAAEMAAAERGSVTSARDDGRETSRSARSAERMGLQ